MKIGYKLINNPSRAELLAMVDVVVSSMKGIHYALSSIDDSTEDYKILEKSIPSIAYTILQSDLITAEEFNNWVRIEEERVEDIFKLN